MAEGSRYSRVAGVVLGVAGVFLLAAAAITFAQALPMLLGAEGEHMAGDAWLWVLIVVLPLTVGAVATLLVTWGLWRARPAARALLTLWMLAAGVICWIAWTAEMNSLSSLRRIVAESGRWSVSGRDFGVTTPDGATYYGQLDDPTFWAPGLVALVIVALLVILVAWAVSDLRRAPAGRPGAGA